MKHMMICCGAGVATSTVALKKMEVYLQGENLLDKVRISQGTVAEAVTRDDVDFIVSTSPVNDCGKAKKIAGQRLPAVSV